MAKKILGYVELIWTCDSCGTKNPGAIKSCTACGAPQPIGVRFEQVDADSFNFIKDEALIRMAQQGPDKHCPYCGTRNLADALTCVQCNGDLTVGAKSRPSGMVVGQDAQPTEVEIDTPGSLPGYERTATPMSRGLLLLIILAVLGLCFFFMWNTFKANRTTDVNGVVLSTAWERSMAIEAYTTVTESDWLSNIPSNASAYGCSSRLKYNLSTYVPGSVESCGEPYTVDTGTGIGQVVQDCVYQVYEDYCRYETQAWVVVDTVTTSGTDAYASWPDLNLMQNQRLGGRSERYTIYFDVNGRSYNMRTSNFELYQSAVPGSSWTLAVTEGGDIRRAEPNP